MKRRCCRRIHFADEEPGEVRTGENSTGRETCLAAAKTIRTNLIALIAMASKKHKEPEKGWSNHTADPSVFFCAQGDLAVHLDTAKPEQTARFVRFWPSVARKLVLLLLLLLSFLIGPV